MGKKIVQLGRPQMAICRICISCWLSQLTKTVSDYVILIAFPLQKWLYGRPSMLHYTYTACLVKFYKRARERNTTTSVYLIGSIRPFIILSISDTNEDSVEI